MSKSIQQGCINFIDNVMKYFSEGMKTFVDLEEGLKEISDEFIRSTIKTYLEEIDKEVAKDKAGRKKRGLVVERRDENRNVFTRFGEVDFKRSYYKDKRELGYVHPVDKVVGLESYERISLSVASDLVNHSAEVSYGQSSRHVTQGYISRQTVMNKVRKIDDLSLEGFEKKRNIEVLHISADEDHVPMQDGSNTWVPLITVYEGVRWVCKGRYECINPRHFSCYGEKIEDLWLKVSSWIYENYEGCEKIYIHGDGASWIRSGLGHLPKAVFVLDEYHQNKVLMRATGAQPGLREEIRRSLRSCDKKEFYRLIKELKSNVKTENELIRILDFKSYIRSNWDGIEIKRNERCGGCCAEGQVSHVLSVRLSSRPMGWSREGLSYMTRLRTYWVNGGTVGPGNIRKDEKIEQYIKAAIRRAKKVFACVNPDTLDNVYTLRAGKVTPVYKMFRNINSKGYY